MVGASRQDAAEKREQTRIKCGGHLKWEVRPLHGAKHDLGDRLGRRARGFHQPANERRHVEVVFVVGLGEFVL